LRLSESKARPTVQSRILRRIPKTSKTRVSRIKNISMVLSIASHSPMVIIVLLMDFLSQEPA
jgi:hypothetical protein